MAPNARTGLELQALVTADPSELGASIERSIGDAFKKAFTGGAGAIALAYAAKNVKQFTMNAIDDMVSFETEMTRVFQVLPDLSSTAVESMARDITDLSNTYGVEADKIAQATAVAAGRGISDLAEFEESTARLATTVGADVKDIATVVSAAMNQYGESVLDAGRANDILYEASRKSSLQVPVFGKALYDVLPSASALGISFEETAAALATVTAGGTPAAVATTQLRTTLYELGQETSKAGEAFRSVAGLSFTEFINKGGSLAQAMDVINEAQGKNGKQLRELTESYYTANQIVALSGPNAERYAKTQDDVARSTGAVARAQEMAVETLDYQQRVMREQLANTRREFAVTFGPIQLAALRAMNAGISSVIEPIRNLSANISAFISENQERFDDLGESFGEAFDQTVTATTALIKTAGPFFAEIATNLLDVAIAATDVWTIFRELFSPFFIGMLTAVAGALVVITEAMSWMARLISDNQTAFKALVATLSVLVAVTHAFRVLALALFLGKIAVSAVLLVARLAGLLRIVTVLRTAFIILGIAMQTNPIGATIALVAALAAGFAVLWRESETFRDIVVSSFNTVKNTVLSAVQFMIRVWSAWPLFVLRRLKDIVDALKWVPDWAGGGAINGASAAIGGIISGIEKVISAVDDLAEAGKNANWVLAKTLGASDDMGAAASAAALNDPNFLASLAPAPSSSGGTRPQGGLFSLDDSAAKESARAAEAAAKALAASLKGIIKGLNDYAKNISKKSVDSIQSSYESLLEKMREARQKASEAGQRGTASLIQSQIKKFREGNKQLITTAKQRDKILDQLSTARDSLKSIKDESADFVKSMRDGVTALGSVMRSTGGIAVTFTGMRNNFRKAIAETRAFTNAMNQLRASGLNETSLRQLAEAGPAEGLRQAQVLARSGAAGISQINAFQKELEAAGMTLASGLNSEFYTAGIKAAEGLVAGLASQEDKIVKAMDNVATKLVKQIKKQLKIKSPSMVFDEEVGAQIPAGIERGIHRGGPDLERAMDRLADITMATSFGAGSVQVNGVSDPAAARRAGIMAGQGIVQVLEDRRNAARLAGVGN